MPFRRIIFSPFYTLRFFSAWFLPGRGKLPALLNGELFLLFRIFSGWFFREGEFMMLMNIFGIVVGLYLATQDHMPTWFCVLFACLLYTDIIFWVVFAIGNRKRISGKKRRGGGIDG